MLKLLGLFVGLAAIAAARTEPPPSAAAAPVLSSAAASTPPLYATRDVLSGRGLPQP